MENGDFTCNDTATLAMFAAMQVSAKLNRNKGRPSRGAVPHLRLHLEIFCMDVTRAWPRLGML